MTYRCYAQVAPGLEDVTRAELAALGLKPLAVTPGQPAPGQPEDTGGVEFDARPAELLRVNLHLRTASRVIARVGELDAIGFDELRRKAAKLGWREFIRPGQQVAIRVTCRKSRLYHSDAVGREVAEAISLGLKGDVLPVKPDPNADQPAQMIVVRIVNDHVTVSVDSSGALLHRRGYRLQTAKAPLRETLAAGLLLAAGWDAKSTLLDPFCGSGTIPIEAALLAGNIAPGKNRRFAFMDWPNFKQSMWQEQLDAAAAAEIRDLPPIFGSDRDDGAIAISAENARRAGLEGKVTFTGSAFSAVSVPAPAGWLVTNPPYGVRVSPTGDLRNLYSRLGDWLRAGFTGWHYGYLCTDPILAGHTHLRPTRTLSLSNGGLPVKFFVGDV